MMNLRTATPVARKAHRCGWCHAIIEPGTLYNRSTNIGDDGLYEFVSCVACMAAVGAVWDWAYRPDEGVGEDSFSEWAHDYVTDPEHGEQARAYLARRGCSCSRCTEATS